MLSMHFTFRKLFRILAWKVVLVLFGAVVAPALLCAEDRGQLFFPIGIFSVDVSTDLADVKAAGFNAVHTYGTATDYLLDYARKAESAGLKVLMLPGQTPGRPLSKKDFNEDSLTTFLKKMKNSSAVLAWYLIDEPDMSHIAKKALADGINMINSVDAAHLTALTVAKPEQYAEYANITDILMVDPYPVPDKNIDIVAEAIDRARALLKDNRQVWVILQVFGYQNEKNNGWSGKREPTYDEMRAMTYLSVIHGAKGIFYYTYHGSRYNIKDSPSHWEDLKKIVKELNAYYPLLISDNSAIQISATEIGEKTRRPVHATARLVLRGNDVLDQGNYIMAVNTSNISQKIRFDIIPAAGLKQAVGVTDKRILQITNNAFEDDLSPYAVRIYRLQ